MGIGRTRMFYNATVETGLAAHKCQTWLVLCHHNFEPSWGRPGGGQLRCQADLICVMHRKGSLVCDKLILLLRSCIEELLAWMEVLVSLTAYWVAGNGYV
jgi:hypothetical protein